MKFFAPIVLLAVGALAAPNPTPDELCERDDSTVNTIMTTVLNGIQALDASILAYNGGPGKELEQASTTMLTIIRTATNNAAAMTPLTTDEAIAFQPLSDKLNAAGDKLLTDLDSKLDLFAKSCACDTTLNWVAQVGSNVNTLMVTISTKFPAGGKGGDEIDHFNKIFAEMKDKLSTCTGKVCNGAPGAPGAPGGNSTAPPYGKPSSPAGNGTKNAEPSSTVKPVVTAGAAMRTFSGAGLVAAFFAFLL